MAIATGLRDIGALFRLREKLALASMRIGPMTKTKALVVTPGAASRPSIEEREMSDAGGLLVRAVALGICATDHEILDGRHGEAPKGREKLVIGHESIGRVVEAPDGSGFERDDWVVGVVRYPDPVPCESCNANEWDMCTNERFTERGIKARDGFGSEHFRVEPPFAFRVDPRLGELGVLLEPASVLAKAWEQVERIGHRAHWKPKRVIVTGAGPVGLLAALMGVQRGLEVVVVDKTESGPKPALVKAVGAHYHAGSLESVHPAADVIIECTGASAVVLEALEHVAPSGVVCLTGVSKSEKPTPADLGTLNLGFVVGNRAVVGSVNANRRHYALAHDSLLAADKSWLGRMITRRVPFARFEEAFEKHDDDVKVLITFP